MILKAIQRELKRQDMTRYALAQKAGLHINTVYRAFRENICLTCTADKMMEVLGLEVRSGRPGRKTNESI
jgi:hypothetical protein